MASVVSQKLTLNCGLQLENRLVKAAMAEHMADGNSLPTELHDRAYAEWGRGGWGMLLTGNVQVDRMYLGGAGDNTVNPAIEAELLRRWKSWAAASTSHGTPTVMQISHPGRQSPLGAGARCMFAKNVSPSAIPLDLGSGWMARLTSSVVFGTPREMTQEDINHVIQQFVYTAQLAHQAGFQGIQLHAAHGYLLAQFLSAKTNRRTDRYGNSSAGRVKMIVDIIQAIRAAVPATFCVGIKLNSVDHQSESELKSCIEQLRLIVEAGVDFVEISGGTYEDPKMMGATPHPVPEKSARTVAREAFFLEFARAIRAEFPGTPLMVTGGFRTRQGMEKALADGDCDMIGIGRPAVLNPTLPNDILLNPDVPEERARLATQPISPSRIIKLTGIKSAGSGAESRWYSAQIQKMARSAATSTT
ncbi:NADH:flavin oxidoreductase/NADH oxidase family protein [Aspergillus ibericus CBS 121593]|uniref:FMN binding oxidoreductase n=1 Tax=Aspergillus ibericus CBS 121593 TaxID=1448316 RepID=A0A395GL97_9EURO|nr:FMN binding oxidoreductase [Aspergillus ibericus CBS 121593]RAK95597.1 FMN binding oxidoreductase [Aspergillus ibericus CBS 121593]